MAAARRPLANLPRAPSERAVAVRVGLAIRYSTARDRLRPGAEVRPRALAPAAGRGASLSVDLLTSRAYTTVHHLVLLLSLPQAEAFHRRRKGSPPSRLENAAAPPGGSDAGRRRARYVAENPPCSFEPVPVSPALARAARPGVWKSSAVEFVRSQSDSDPSFRPRARPRRRSRRSLGRRCMRAGLG